MQGVWIYHNTEAGEEFFSLALDENPEEWLDSGRTQAEAEVLARDLGCTVLGYREEYNIEENLRGR